MESQFHESAANTAQQRHLGRHRSPCAMTRNISDSEGMASLLGGSGLFVAGLATGKWRGALMCAIGGALLYRGWTGHCHLYESLGLDSATHPPQASVPAQQGKKVERVVVIQQPPEMLYSFWRDFENLPKVMQHLDRVIVLDDKRSRWFANGPLGVSVEWEAEIINDRENEMIAWRSLPGSQVETAGSVHFRPLDENRGTAVTVSMKYNPPAGKLGDAIASMLGSGLGQQLAQDLQQLKLFMESDSARLHEPSPESQQH
jgi:uncharacterized membrane protein